MGETVPILGKGFTADSLVFFNGVPTQITEVYPTYMRVVVPDGATNGFITETTAKGTLKSNKGISGSALAKLCATAPAPIASMLRFQESH